MPGHALRERLAQDIGGWLTDGFISKETHDLLRQRYDARRFGAGQAFKYLGFSGGLLGAAGLLGFIAAMGNSLVLAALIALSAGVALMVFGIRLSNDTLGRYPGSSKVILALGAIFASAGVAVALGAAGIEGAQLVTMTGLVVVPVLGFLAYRYGNVFLLVLALLAYFHWVGSWTAMFGRSSYGILVEDPRVMAVAALMAVLAGVFHELELRARTGRFFQAYQATGLVYLNLSLLILTIDPGYHWGGELVWILLLAAAGIGQIVAGARLHNGLFTGFGVTAVALDIYTRYFEHFWESTRAGAFFLLGGLSLLGAGVACELLMKRVRKVSP